MEAVKITEQYIAGFVDGEGCFALTLRKDKGKYFYWKAVFSIGLRGDDHKILEKIMEYFGVGHISFTKSRDTALYQVSHTAELNNTIIPFFDKNKLIGKKGSDYGLWREAVFLIAKNKKKESNSRQGTKGFILNEWDKNDVERLKEIRNEMQSFKSGSFGRTLKY